MRKALVIMLFSLLLLSCGSKEAKTEGTGKDNRTDVEQTRPDTIVQGKAERSGNDSIMRGFDPVSEDDMTDNGMNRYMENNDDEGWE